MDPTFEGLEQLYKPFQPKHQDHQLIDKLFSTRTNANHQVLYFQTYYSFNQALHFPYGEFYFLDSTILLYIKPTIIFSFETWILLLSYKNLHLKRKG